jgi:hypothetical protein
MPSSFSPSRKGTGTTLINVSSFYYLLFDINGLRVLVVFLGHREKEQIYTVGVMAGISEK